MVTPFPSAFIAPVKGQELEPVVGHKVHRADDVVNLRVGMVVGQGQARETRPKDLQMLEQRLFVRVTCVGGKAQQTLPVWTGTLAAAAALWANQRKQGANGKEGESLSRRTPAWLKNERAEVHTQYETGKRKTFPTFTWQ